MDVEREALKPVTSVLTEDKAKRGQGRIWLSVTSTWRTGRVLSPQDDT